MNSLSKHPGLPLAAKLQVSSFRVEAMMASLYSERAKACMRLKDWRGVSY